MNKKTYEVAVINRDDYVRTDVRDPKEMWIWQTIWLSNFCNLPWGPGMSCMAFKTVLSTHSTS